MGIRLIVLTAVLWAYGYQVLGQDSREVTAYEKRLEAKSSIVLLKNRLDFLPLQGLDTLNIATVSWGEEIATDFTKRVDSYVESYHITISGARDLDNRLAADLSSRNVMLMMLDSSANGLEELLSWLGHNVQRTSIVLLIKGDSTLVNDVLRSDVDSLVESIVYTRLDSASIVDDLMVQAIFGGVSISGVLKDSLSVDFPKGYGLRTSGPVRLKYSVPEEFGVSYKLLDSGITEIVTEGLDSGAFPGCQILVAKRGSVIYTKSFGYHTYDSIRAVVDSDIYDLASVTKVTAATLAMMTLYDDGLVDLDAVFSRYWPDFKRSDKASLVVRDVLAHHARLRPWIPYYLESRRRNGRYKRNTFRTDSSARYPHRISGSVFMHRRYKENKLYPMIRKSALNEEVGYVYSGLSFYLYPQIVENLTGVPFQNYLDDAVYRKLGATTLQFNPTAKFDLTRIVPTENDDFFRMEQLHGTVHDEGAAVMKGISGNAGLFGNANDLAKVWQMFLNGGTYGTERFIKNESIKEFTKCQFCSEGNRRGLGFDKPLVAYDSLKSSVARAADPSSYGHSGYTGTLVWADPKSEILFIFLSNRVYPTRDNRKLYTLNIRPRIHHFIYECLEGNVQD